MPTRTSAVSSIMTLVVDPTSIVQNNGVQILWSEVDASYEDVAAGGKVLPAGTVLAAGTTGYIERVNTTDALGILLTDASEENLAHSLSGYGMAIGGVFYENMLPDSGDVAWATIKAELEAIGSFQWQDLTDSTV